MEALQVETRRELLRCGSETLGPGTVVNWRFRRSREGDHSRSLGGRKATSEIIVLFFSATFLLLSLLLLRQPLHIRNVQVPFAAVVQHFERALEEFGSVLALALNNVGVVRSFVRLFRNREKKRKRKAGANDNENPVVGRRKLQHQQQHFVALVVVVGSLRAFLAVALPRWPKNPDQGR